MGQNKKGSLFDSLVLGLAMFAIFFGAGNLIFPPYLGMLSGTQWFIGFLCFIVADAGLAIMTVLALERGDGTILSATGRLGKRASGILAATAMLCVGPLICIPRTAAVTFEMAMLPLLPGFNKWIFAVAFFAIVYLLTVRPSAVVDIIGKYLTPAMLVVLGILFIKGIMTPIGDILPPNEGYPVAKEGFLAGYQTMDVLGALAITYVLSQGAIAKGYMEKKTRFRVLCAASLVAFIGLFLVYCGLAFLGATSSGMRAELDISQVGLVVTITNLLLKKAGVTMLAVIVFLACMTTAIGLTSSTAEYFSRLSKGRVAYKSCIGIICLAGIFIASLGTTFIIETTAPILEVIYPVLLTQIVLSFFTKAVKKDSVPTGAAVGAAVVCLLGVLEGYGLVPAFTHYLPFAGIGFYWVLPAVVGAGVGALWPAR